MSDWQPIETAPRMKNLLLFAVTDIGDSGEIRNWKMETGYWSSGHNGWIWGGCEAKEHMIQPTHWMPLPDAPLLLNANTD